MRRVTSYEGSAFGLLSKGRIQKRPFGGRDSGRAGGREGVIGVVVAEVVRKAEFRGGGVI